MYTMGPWLLKAMGKNVVLPPTVQQQLSCWNTIILPHNPHNLIPMDRGLNWCITAVRTRVMQRSATSDCLSHSAHLLQDMLCGYRCVYRWCTGVGRSLQGWAKLLLTLPYLPFHLPQLGLYFMSAGMDTRASIRVQQGDHIHTLGSQ